MRKQSNSSRNERKPMTKAKKPIDVTPEPIKKPVFKPISDHQKKAYELCEKNDITILTGEAGCSKTFCAVAYAIDFVLREKGRRIVLTRPAVEACGEEIGALPGGIAEKMSPFMHPLNDVIREYAEGIPIPIEVTAMAHVRGRTFKNSVVVIDEAQNASMRQLKLIMTRIGNGSKMIFCGDCDQSDIKNSGLREAAKLLQDITGIGWYDFPEGSSVARHPLIPKILKALP